MGLLVAGLPLEEAQRIQAIDICQHLSSRQLAFLFAKYGAYKVIGECTALKTIVDSAILQLKRDGSLDIVEMAQPRKTIEYGKAEIAVSLALCGYPAPKS